jgi:hypothetical protein
MQFWNRLAFIAACAVMATVGQARADLITFNSVPSSGNPIITNLNTVGWNFASGHFHTIDSPTGVNAVNNGTIYIGEEAGNLGQVITMSKIGGDLFTLTSFDGSKLWVTEPAGFPNATSITVVGNLFGGGTVSQTFTLNAAASFQNYVLNSSFTNLTSATFNRNGAIAIDNITASAVPVPAGVVLAGMGLVGAYGLRRRFRGTAAV